MRATAIILCTALAGTLHPAPVAAVTLWEHYQSALRKNADFLTQVALSQIDVEQPKVRRSLLLPQVSIGISKTRRSKSDEAQQNGSPPSKKTKSHDLTVRQSLFNLRDFLLYQQTHDVRDATLLRVEAARSALMIKVAEAYFNVLWTRQQLGFTNFRLRAIREQLNSIRKGVEAGSATRLDELRIQAELKAVAAARISARGDYELALRNLSLVSGIDDEALNTPTTFTVPVTDRDLDSLLLKVTRNNFEIRALRKDLKAADTGVEAALGVLLPEVVLSATRSRSDNEQDGRDYSTVTSVQIEWTLFSGGGTKPAYRQAVATKKAAQTQLSGGVQALSNEVARSLNQIRNGESRIRALEASVQANEELVDIVTYGFNESINVLSDVLDAQQDLENARSLLARARYDLLLDSLRLLAASGELVDERFMEFTEALKG